MKNNSVTRHAHRNKNNMKYGYAVRDNDLGMQLKALHDFGCDDISFGDELPQVIEGLKQGDVLAVWRLDKLAADMASVESAFKEVHRAGASIELLFEKLNSISDHKEILSQLIDVMKKIEEN
ncbi:recombinase family protein [Vibrio parahaemolyticus]|nr:recombinase family protein [Vibrio parahaemolyticus]